MFEPRLCRMLDVCLGLVVRTCRGDVIIVGKEAPQNYVVSKAGIATAKASCACGARLWPPVYVNIGSFV